MLIVCVVLAFLGLFVGTFSLLESVSNEIMVEAPDKAKEASEEWRTRDKTRSTRFISRIFLSHTVGQSTKLLHNMGGLFAWSLSFLGMVWTVVTGGQRGPSILAKAMAVSVFAMNLGFFTPRFQRKLSRYGRFQYGFHQFTIIVFGFATGANSIYAQPTVSDDVNMDTIAKLSTFLSLISPVVSLVFFVQGMIQKTIWISALPFIAYSTSLPYFYAPIIYELLCGKKALVQLYENTRVGDVVYFLHVSGLFTTLTDQIFITLSLIKVLSMEQTHRIASKMWLSYGAFVILLLAAALGPTVALAYVFLFGFVFPFHKIFPVKNLRENRKELGLFVEEHGGNSLAPGVEGSKKKK